MTTAHDELDIWLGGQRFIESLGVFLAVYDLVKSLLTALCEQVYIWDKFSSLGQILFIVRSFNKKDLCTK